MIRRPRPSRSQPGSTPTSSPSGTPTGTVEVTDQEGGGCTGPAPSGSCQYTPNGFGTRTIMATYPGNSSFNGSSDTDGHTVRTPPQPPAATTTTITDDSPDPSDQNVPFTVSFTVASGSGVPSGDVTVSDGTDSCSGSLDGSGSGSCPLILTTAGSRTLTATYPGSSSFAESSGSESHVVTATPPPPPPNQAPTAAFSSSCDAALICTFTDASSDPDGDETITTWSWDFGDSGSAENTSGLENPQHSYPAAGDYVVTLTVTDNGDETGTSAQSVPVPTP